MLLQCMWVPMCIGLVWIKCSFLKITCHLWLLRSSCYFLLVDLWGCRSWLWYECLTQSQHSKVSHSLHIVCCHGVGLCVNNHLLQEETSQARIEWCTDLGSHLMSLNMFIFFLQASSSAFSNWETECLSFLSFHLLSLFLFLPLLWDLKMWL